MSISNDIVKRVIELAIIVRSKKVNRGPISFDPTKIRIEELGMPSEQRELEKYINELSDEEKAELMAIMWLGRQAANEQLEEYESLIKDGYSMLDHVGDYLGGKRYLPEYLHLGMQKLGRTI